MKMTMRYAHLSPAFLSAEVSLLDPPKPPLQPSLLDDCAAPVEYSYEKVPWDVFGISDPVRVSDGIDVDERALTRRDPQRTEQHLEVGALNRESAIPDQEQRRHQQRESGENVSSA
jgi:hypothetical protein